MKRKCVVPRCVVRRNVERTRNSGEQDETDARWAEGELLPGRQMKRHGNSVPYSLVVCRKEGASYWIALLCVGRKDVVLDSLVVCSWW